MCPFVAFRKYKNLRHLSLMYSLIHNLHPEHWITTINEYYIFKLWITRNVILTHLNRHQFPVRLSLSSCQESVSGRVFGGDSCYSDDEVFLVFCCHGNFGHLISPTREAEEPHLMILHAQAHALVHLITLSTTCQYIKPPYLDIIHACSNANYNAVCLIFDAGSLLPTWV